MEHLHETAVETGQISRLVEEHPQADAEVAKHWVSYRRHVYGLVIAGVVGVVAAALMGILGWPDSLTGAVVVLIALLVVQSAVGVSTGMTRNRLSAAWDEKLRLERESRERAERQFRQSQLEGDQG